MAPRATPPEQPATVVAGGANRPLPRRTTLAVPLPDAVNRACRDVIDAAGLTGDAAGLVWKLVTATLARTADRPDAIRAATVAVNQGCDHLCAVEGLAGDLEDALNLCVNATVCFVDGRVSATAGDSRSRLAAVVAATYGPSLSEYLDAAPVDGEGQLAVVLGWMADGPSRSDLGASFQVA